jgi:ATP-binding cassette subfamily B protein
MAQRREFTIEGAPEYNHRNRYAWLFSHLLRNRFFLLLPLVGWIAAFGSYSAVRVLIGEVAEYILDPIGENPLLVLTLGILALTLGDSIGSISGTLSLEILAKRTATNVREELYRSLLGKSQVYHDRQRTGDIMARATEDVNGVMDMITPGFVFVMDAVIGTITPLVFIGLLEPRLLLVPMIFVLAYIVVIRRYVRHLTPVINNQREQFGKMNASLEESITGIELVKASTMEAFERLKFRNSARQFRNYFVQQGEMEARYLPLLMYAVAFGATFLHAMWLYEADLVGIPTIIAVMGIFGILRFPVFISIFAWSILQNGISSAGRILKVIEAETDLDENPSGYAGQLRGEIVFENVTFGYEDGNVLENISFRIESGQTIAIVGQTGSGKSTLTELVNRTYDVTGGRVLIDGVDVREWNLHALRSQVAKIEQDIFLFSRSVAENIAFGAPDTPQAQIKQAAKEAQAHEFILSFQEGYQTKVGERGVTLSGGQRQRLALARAFLSNPRILILDDSTSAIDSATEDQIQKALRRAQQGRTTLLITHRLSQIRWADHILMIDAGRLVASGTHEQLLRSSAHYRRIFARYEAALPTEAIPAALVAGS